MTTESPVTVDLERLTDIEREHYVVGPSLSPDNYDDSSTCSCGRDSGECDTLFLLAPIAENRRLARLGELDVDVLANALRLSIYRGRKDSFSSIAEKVAHHYATLAAALQESHDAR